MAARPGVGLFPMPLAATQDITQHITCGSVVSCVLRLCTIPYGLRNAALNSIGTVPPVPLTKWVEQDLPEEWRFPMPPFRIDRSLKQSPPARRSRYRLPRENSRVALRVTGIPQSFGGSNRFLCCGKADCAQRKPGNGQSRSASASNKLHFSERSGLSETYRYHAEPIGPGRSPPTSTASAVV